MWPDNEATKQKDNEEGELSKDDEPKKLSLVMEFMLFIQLIRSSSQEIGNDEIVRTLGG